jgi:formate transporter
MYYIPLALLMQWGAPASFWETIHKTPADFPNLSLYNFFIGNLLPVTLGNIIGGAVMVGVVYWFVYLRKRSV